MNKIKKALDVLSDDCENPIIKADMIGVIKRELDGNVHTLDMAADHNAELAAEITDLRSLLNECLRCLNEMPNRYIKKQFMTYDLAAKIETLLRG